MEKVCVRYEYQSRGEKRFGERYEYQFTAEEIDRLAIALEGYDAKRVKDLIRHLEFSCQDLKHITTYGGPKRGEAYRDRVSALNTLTKTVRLLKNMQYAKGGGAFVADWTRSLLQLHQNRAAVSSREYPEDVHSKIFPLLSKTITALEEIINTIEERAESEERGERGRPDADALGIAQTIAQLLQKHLDIMPTAYPGGVFANIVRICLEAVNLPYTDPSRAIRQAVESFPVI